MTIPNALPIELEDVMFTIRECYQEHYYRDGVCENSGRCYEVYRNGEHIATVRTYGEARLYVQFEVQ